jgi:NAD+ synthetase
MSRTRPVERCDASEVVEDATQLAKNLGVEMQTISIERPLASFHEILKLSGIASENIQARIRGNILMAISNKENAMVLTTGNKSEIAVGYCTIYGDMCGGYNPIKDLYKTQVFAIMKFINEVGIANIPERIITKEPSAELKENQKDSDFLPRYEILDAILFELIENNKQPEELGNFDAEIVKKIWKLINNSEYKRFQSAPGTKISKRSFEPSEWRKNIV